MSTALTVVNSNRPSYTEAEMRARSIISRMDSLAAKLKTLEDDIRLLWIDFENLKTGEKILGCSTKAEFCEKKLHRTPRAIQYLLAGQSNPANRPHKESELSSPHSQAAVTTAAVKYPHNLWNPISDGEPHENWMAWTANHLWDPSDRELVEGYGIALLRRHIEFWARYVDNPSELLGLTESEFAEHQGRTQSEALHNRKEFAVPLRWMDATGKMRGTTNGLWMNGQVLNKLIRAAAGDSVKPYSSRQNPVENPTEMLVKPATLASQLETLATVTPVTPTLAEPAEQFPTPSRTTLLREWFKEKWKFFKLGSCEHDLVGMGGRMGKYDLLLIGLTPRQVKLVGEALQPDTVPVPQVSA